MGNDVESKRAAAIEELRSAFAEIESTAGLTRLVGGHGIQSRVFEFEWREPSLEISFRLPYARVLSDEATQKEGDAEISAAIRMAILRLPYIFLISVIVGITNMIPYFGPFIGAVPGAIILLVVDPMKAVIFLIMILCLQQFDGLVLGPKLLGNSTGMKPIWIIFAITIGGRFFGVPGMFLGVPAFAILGYLAERYMRYRLRKRNISMEDIL